jgi:ABC-type phosphate/phosphonate transport system substrate-binding protein
MRKRRVMLTCMLFLLSAGGSEAAPLPDTSYIDGMPCSRLCQSYAAWFHQLSSTPAPRSPKAPARRATGMGRDRSKPAPAAGNSAIQSYPARARVTDRYPTDGAAANSKTRTIREPVAAATAVADRVTPPTAVPASEHEANSTARSGQSKTVQSGDAEKVAPASPTDADHLVAVLMARPEIKSVSDLTGKNIAIDDEQSASAGNVQRAIAAAGATEVQLSGDQTTALNRLISGEVSAAILTLAYPEAAEWFPDVAGFKIFRIPLSPPSLKARPEPADNAAVSSNARTIKQRIAAATALAEKVTDVAAIPAPNPASPNEAVAVLMARPEIKSVADLTGKTIAIDDRQSASTDNVRTALVAAGAAEAQLSEGQAKAVDRLISGEASAAVLTLVSSEAAEWFPDVAGFKIFRIPLSPPSLKARP